MFKCANQPGAPQITCDEGKWAVSASSPTTSTTVLGRPRGGVK